MSLTRGERGINTRELEDIGSFIDYLYEGDVLAKLQDLLPIVEEELYQHGIILGVPDGNKLLQDLLVRHAFEKRVNEEKLRQELKVFALHYRELERQASDEMRRRAEKQPLGLTRSLYRLGAVEDRAWGEDYDIEMILKGDITDPHEVKRPGIYVLPPVLLVASENASKEEKAAPHAFLQNTLATALQTIQWDEDEAATFLIPVNCGQNHWRLVRVEASSDGHLHSTLWDSAANSALDKTPAARNMKKAVTAIDPHASFECVAEGIQKNGYSCMDYVVQKIVRTVSERGALDEADRGLVAIRDADSASKLRLANIKRITEKAPNLQMKDPALDQQVKEIFKESVKEEDLEETLFATFNQFANKKGNLARKMKGLQDNFDSLMAKKLDELYQNNPNASESDDKKLLKQARAYAVNKLKNRLGFFESKAPVKHERDEARRHDGARKHKRS